jgi:hypothetical protein
VDQRSVSPRHASKGLLQNMGFSLFNHFTIVHILYLVLCSLLGTYHMMDIYSCNNRVFGVWSIKKDVFCYFRGTL